jgi:hypothetical protein
MKQKKDAKGRFVKMYITREEYEAKIAKLQETIDSLAIAGQQAKNDAAYWKQEYICVKQTLREQEEMTERAVKMRNWLYSHGSIILRWRYRCARRAGKFI